MILRTLSQAGLARLAGVSRAAVSKWFRQGGRDGWINVETRTIFALARSLKVEPSRFFVPQEDLTRMEPRLLWDRLYSSVESLLQAAIDGRLCALARLVEVFGFHEAQGIVGQQAVESFQRFKRFVPPARRRALETIWPLYQNAS